MAKSYPDQLGPGAFIATTSAVNSARIYETAPGSDEFKQLLVTLYEQFNSMALLLNLKDTGYYALSEFVNGQAFFPDTSLSSTTARTPVYRQVFRKVINFGALPNTGTTSVAHGLTIDSSFTFTRIYGCASDTSGNAYIPLPYASPTLANNIEIDVDATNVNITTGSDRTAFTTTYVILEYLKQ